MARVSRSGAIALACALGAGLWALRFAGAGEDPLSPAPGGTTGTAARQGGEGASIRAPEATPAAEPVGPARSTDAGREPETPRSGAERISSDLVVWSRDAGGLPRPEVPLELVAWRSVGERHDLSLARAVSDRQGRAVFPADSFASVLAGARRVQMELEFRVRCLLPFDEEPSLLLREPLGDGGPFDLVLPPTGWIEVDLAPSPEPRARPAEVDRLTWSRVREDASSGREKALDGDPVTRRVGPLGLGWNVRIEARNERRPTPIGSVVVAGPTRADEVVRVRLETTGSLEITGHVTDEAGRSVADEILVVLARAGPAMQTGFTRTNAEGGFALAFEYGLALDSLELRRVEGGELAPSARIDLAATPADAATLDVGTVVLVAPPRPREVLIAEGRVTDELGAPLAGALVVAFADPEDPDSEVGKDLTRADGSFHLAEKLPLGVERVEVRAEKRGYAGIARETCAVGDRGLRLSLPRGAELAGSVLVSEWVPLDLVKLVLQGGRLADKRVLADWTEGFLFDGEEAHEAVLEVGIRDASWVLERLAGLRLEPPLRTTLDPIDVRGRVKRLQLVVRDAAGAPLTLPLRIVDPHGEGFRALEPSRDGTVEHLVPSSVEQLRISARGYDEATVTLAPSPVEVVLHATER